jgi:hypothetical protein
MQKKLLILVVKKTWKTLPRVDERIFWNWLSITHTNHTISIYSFFPQLIQRSLKINVFKIFDLFALQQVMIMKHIWKAIEKPHDIKNAFKLFNPKSQKFEFLSQIPFFISKTC